MSPPLDFLPKPMRPVAQFAIVAAALFGVGVACVSFLEAKADARVSIRLDPISSCVSEMKADLKAIRQDTAKTREDVAELRGALRK